MPDYRRFLIKQRVSIGIGFADGGTGHVIDTQSVFGCVCADSSFSYLSEGREPASREWYDEDGEDVYMPQSTSRKVSGYDWDVSFLFVATSPSTLRHYSLLFRDYLYGRSTEAGTSQEGVGFLSVYDEYTGIGHDGIYVKKITPESFIFDDGDPTCVAELKVTFRVTSPSNIVLTL